MSEQKSTNLTTAESTMINGASPSKKRRKHIHEIRLDDLIIRESTSEDLSHLCDTLFQQESLYLDPKTISKSQVSCLPNPIQVMGLLQKIYEQLFPPILRNQKSVDSTNDEPERPTFPENSRAPTKQEKIEIKSPDRAIVSLPTSSMLSSANKQNASKPGPIKASRDILPVNKANEDAFLA